MKVVLFEISDDKLVDALDALRPLSPGKLRVMEDRPVPPSPARELELEQLAAKIAKAIAPRPDQHARRDALRLVLGGGDTFNAGEGEADPALRNATGALSRALRRFDPFAESPIELLCERRREIFTKGEHKGTYKGMRYIPTRLGGIVHRILKQQGKI